MDDQSPGGKMKYPERPVNLPAGRAAAEYGSDVIAGLISDMGFKHVFLLPGSSFRGLHDSLVNYIGNQDPEMILCTHEAIAVAMAHGYAKASGGTGLAIVHDLVGLMCGTVSVFNAWADRVPVVVLGGSGPLDPGMRRNIDWVHTANSQSDLIKPFAKLTAEPPTLQATVDAILRARKVAATRPSGPAYVSLDQGVQEGGITDGLVVPDPGLPRYRPPAPIAANPQSIEDAADMLLAAELPLIVGGRFGREAATTGPLVELVETIGAAYIDDRAIVCFPTGHAQNLSGDGDIQRQADVILAVDCVDATNAADAHGDGARGRRGQKIIDMTLEYTIQNSWSNYGGPLSAVDLQIDCDPLHGIGQLVRVLRARLDGENDKGEAITRRKAELSRRHDALRQAQRDRWRENWDASPILPARMVFELHEAVREKPWILTIRNNRGFPEGLWDFAGAGQFLGSDGGGGIGWGPGAAVGAALAVRAEGKFPVAITGDGDFVMACGAIWTACHYRIPLLMVINNNNSWGNDERHQIDIATKRARPTENAWIGQRMVDPAMDFAAICRGFGAWAEGPVGDPGDLAAVFRRAVAEVENGKVCVVDVRTAL